MEINKETKKAILSIEEAMKASLWLRLIDASKKNKLTYAANHLADEISSKLKPYDKKVERLTVEYALKEEDGTFKLTKEGGYLIDPKKLIEYSDKKDELANSMTIEVELYYCKDKELIEKLPVTVLKGLNNLLFEYDFSELETEQN